MGWRVELELGLSFITASIRLLYSHSSETIAVNIFVLLAGKVINP